MTATFSIPRLETERLILRAHKESDIATEIAFFKTEPSHFVGGPKNAEDSWRNIGLMLGHWALRGYGFWALEEKSTGAYVGRVGLWNPLGWFEREIGWTLMPEGTGKGYATEAALAARGYAYDVLGWETAISQIDPKNDASKAVATRLGAAYEQMYDASNYGEIEVWRHPAPSDLVNGGMEAYA
ncbi:MAG: GNAT family N-acetyltransferase [Shimia sp.]|jgi:RimJ/RimL family protein N-acetyltransferase|uniref:GNAT family N-acetyltransferase n=1 Tax=Shimia sp. TaxID=1954381 RepID=UPI004057D890